MSSNKPDHGGIDYSAYDPAEEQEIAPWRAYERAKAQEEDSVAAYSSKVDVSVSKNIPSVMLDPILLSNLKVMQSDIFGIRARDSKVLRIATPSIAAGALAMIGFIQESSAIILVHPMILLPLILATLAFAVSAILSK